VKKRAFDGNRIDDMLADEGAVEPLGDPHGIIERRPGMLRAVERNKDVFDHRSSLEVGFAAGGPAP